MFEIDKQWRRYVSSMGSFNVVGQARRVQGFDVVVQARAAEKESGPFDRNMAHQLVFYAVNGTRDLIGQEGPLDGFNMESFFGFVEATEECNDWPVGVNVTLESCEMKLEVPHYRVWHANLRLFSDAARRGLRALAKVGQAGWKTVAQEHLKPYYLHTWVISAYASFLMIVPEIEGEVPLMLGVHPFAKTEAGYVQPWLHPVFFLDIGRPIETKSLLEEYRISGHPTYVRRFERGIVLYNPYKQTDVKAPLDGEYLDPWKNDCKPVTNWNTAGETGMVLMKFRVGSP